MIAEENLHIEETPNISISNNLVVSLICNLIKQTIPHFKYYIKSGFYKKKKLNEDDLTQIFIEQAQILIRKCDYPFNINGQYRDITNLSKGLSDFYFYPNEEGVSTESIFSVESKRLPSPQKNREKEYLIGESNNGGIQRYKTEKHGKGLYKCGILGFLENETPSYWLTVINGWIEDLANSDKTWDKDEILVEEENNTDYYHLKSVSHRSCSKDIHLDHFWVTLKYEIVIN